MKVGGTITLYYKGQVYQNRIYDSLEKRKRVISMWRLELKERWYSCFYHIRPYVDITRVRPDGTNTNSPIISPGNIE
jgi:hypothetical protein